MFAERKVSRGVEWVAKLIALEEEMLAWND